MEFTTEDKIRKVRRARERRRKIKNWIIFIIVLALLAGAFFSYKFFKEHMYWPWQDKNDNLIQNLAQTTTTEVKVEKTTYLPKIEISGYVVPYDTQSVKLRTSGTVTSVLVEAGDTVKKGQLLATVDDSNAVYNIEETKNQIEAAKIDGNQSNLKLLEMQLKTREKALENTKLYANFDGVVTEVNLKENDYFDAGASVINIIDNSRLKATVEVDEIDIGQLKEGMIAKCTADSAPGVVLEAVVDYIPMVGRYTNSSIGVMDVQILFENFPQSFKPGFSFSGTIDAPEETQILLIPQTAVSTYADIMTVQKKNADGSIQTVEITAKFLSEGYYQVLSGLEEGDTLVITTSNKIGGISLGF